MPTHSPLNTLSDFDLASHVLNVCRIQSLGAAFVAHKLLHSGGSRPSEKAVGGGRGGVRVRVRVLSAEILMLLFPEKIPV